MYFRPMTKWITLLATFFFLVGYAQESICQAGDETRFESRKELLSGIGDLPFSQRIVTLGKSFSGTPYVAGTLEGQDTETLVVNLQSLDCTTFVETVLAMSQLTESQDPTFETFQDNLRAIRYREGKIDGYASRLHYFTDWIQDNANKGMVIDISEELGGIPLEKEINFMSSNRHLYPGLEDDVAYRKILMAEKSLRGAPLHYIPTEMVSEVEEKLQAGDLVAMVTSIAGLDVSHTGILSREEDGRIHLLHASTSEMQVTVSPQPLAAYLASNKKMLGVIVVRPVRPQGP